MGGLEDFASVFEDRELRRASAIYFGGSLIDMISTYCGMETGQVAEKSAVINGFISVFGELGGIGVAKASVGGTSASLLVCANIMREKIASDNFPKKLKRLVNFDVFGTGRKPYSSWNVNKIFEFSGAFTAGVGLSWLVDKYLF